MLDRGLENPPPQIVDRGSWEITEEITVGIVDRGKFSTIVGRENHRENHREITVQITAKRGWGKKWENGRAKIRRQPPSIFIFSTGSPVAKGGIFKNSACGGRPDSMALRAAKKNIPQIVVSD